MYKIWPIVEHLNKVFPKYYHYGPRVVLDESMVAMCSCDTCCQFCPQKPCKWGWKVFLLCDSEYIEKPYLLSFSSYLGKKYTPTSKYGLYFDVVEKMTKFMQGSHVKLYTDFSQFVFGMTQRLSDLFQLVLTQLLFHLL